MNSPQHTARDIFLAARAIESGPQRLSYLRRACGADRALLSRVEALLRADEAAGAFLALPAAEPDAGDGDPESGDTHAAAAVPRLTEHAGQIIGRYKLLQQIGEGGFGSVWMAEQREPVVRKVALKIIKLGMDTRQVIARFEAERQALALMDHPHIAKVLDAGATETGRPYFVMELCTGDAITEYCDKHNLPIRERLELFAQVCHAVQHAHQKGLIHRDIKPSNILVATQDGRPHGKVIDFGIAKATASRLTEKTLFTEHRQLIGTPQYMSPEQAEGSLDIDTRTDVYSLGVLLYELLTGTTPFDPKSLRSAACAEIQRIIREVEPPRPSTRLSQNTGTLASIAARRHIEPKKLNTIIRGELDWIVMKCLEKDRQRRYESASGLAADIRAYLAGAPVLAAPPSAAYRVRKLIQRNRGAVAGGAAVVAALLIGLVAFAWQAKIARKQRDDAVTARKAAQDAEAETAAQRSVAVTQRDRARRELERAEGLVYAGKLLLAQTDFEHANGGFSLHYLSECQESRRGWEWRYLWTRINAELTLAGSLGPVSSAAVSPDSRHIVTGCEDGTAKIWDAATGRELFTIDVPGGLVMSMAWSPDGTQIVTGGGPWGPDQHVGVLKTWDAATGKLLFDFRGHADCVWNVAYSPDGLRIVSAAGSWGYGRGEVKVWSAATGQEEFTLPKQTDRVMGATFSPDGGRIATCGADGKVHLWDAATGRAIRDIAYGGGVWSVAFSPDGRRIIAGDSDGTAKIWDASTGKEQLTLRGHTDWLRSVAFSPDGTRVLTGSADQTAKVWDAATGQEIFSLKGHTGIVRCAVFSPDGKHIVTACHDKTAKVWDAGHGQEVPTLKGHLDFISCIAFSPDSKRIVTGSGDGTAKVWDAATSREIRTFRGSAPRTWAQAAIWSVAFSPDGRSIVTGSSDKTAKVWDVETGRVLLTLEHMNSVSSVAFSPDGRCIATASGVRATPDAGPGGAKIWDSRSGRLLQTLHHAGVVASVGFSPDGARIVTGGDDGMAKVWDVATGAELVSFMAHTRELRGAAFSPDGLRIVTCSLDGTAKVWDAATGKELLTLAGHTGPVRGVTFSPDGSRIVTGSDDHSAKIWDAATGQELLALKAHPAEVWSVAFSPDGQHLATGVARENAIAKLWFAAPPAQIGAGREHRR